MQFLKSLYLTPRVFIVLGTLLVLFVLGFFYPGLLGIARAGLVAVMLLFVIDLVLLYRPGQTVIARREMADKLSNGDENELRVSIANLYWFPVSVQVIDEVPVQFQIRNFSLDVKLATNEVGTCDYRLRPVERGEYSFGSLNVYVASPIGLARRRYRFDENRTVPVYPSYIQMRRYELLAISNRLTEAGIKRVRKLGHTMEFDQIREYVSGDDYRTINWKATARRSSFMVNQYQDERSQQVYSIIDSGRTMKMPFEGLSLLDYAINASLVLSNIAIYRQDRAGLVTFAETIGAVLPADRKPLQMRRIVDALYNVQTRYLESSFELLHVTIKTRLRHRSLIFLYTNFESLPALQRQLRYLRAIAVDHLLVVVFFENTEMASLLRQPATTTEQIYTKAIAEKFAFEKRRIVKELAIHGILSILTPPSALTVNTINKYFELKARRAI